MYNSSNILFFDCCTNKYIKSYVNEVTLVLSKPTCLRLLTILDFRDYCQIYDSSTNTTNSYDILIYYTRITITNFVPPNLFSAFYRVLFLEKNTYLKVFISGLHVVRRIIIFVLLKNVVLLIYCFVDTYTAILKIYILMSTLTLLVL